ncbi:MAG: AbiV family abortive infection protein [Actinobacteria bacterium]|nr:AbiV family abortive infection protein [Actinomycetota bacterium]
MSSEKKNIVGVKECIYNAIDLLESSKILFNNNKYHAAYHLATVALEEIGKSELILIHQLAPKEGAKEWTENQLDDHVKKLFWSFFGTLFGNKKLTTELLENTKGLAQHIHDTRLKGLYVDIIEGVVSFPQNLDYKSECEKLLHIVESRLNLKLEENKYSTYENDSILLPWFLKATDDQEKRKFIIGSKSKEKLAELGDTREWIGWLKNEYDKADEESRKLLEKELALQIPNDEENIPKWKVKFRLYSDSHSIKQKNLNEWNKYRSWIQLTAVSDKKHKNEILVDIIAPKVVKVDRVFMHCWYVARLFTVSLNIGSLGFFWWDLPKFRNKYYEKAFDIENNAEIRMEIRPSLKIDWRKDILTENDMKNIAICYSQILKMGLNNDENNPMNFYFGGLTFLGLNDLNYRCENQSFINFYLCLKNALTFYGIWNSTDNYYDVFYETLKSLGLLKKDIVELYDYGEKLLEKKSNEVKITLEEVGSMKIVCDAFFIKRFRSQLKKKKV